MPKILTKKLQRGFTLIELLVVIAIIGILASVILVALNSARDKGRIATIKSNLKNMINQVELSYDTTGNYSGACAAVAGMLTSINNTGGHAACYSHNNPSYSDVNIRWAASAKNSDGTKNWAVDSNGVVTFDNADTGPFNQTWAVATAACAATGGRLPTLDELKALYNAYGGGPTNFTFNVNYWSSTTLPSDNNSAYYLNSYDGVVRDDIKAQTLYARCVRS